MNWKCFLLSLLGFLSAIVAKSQPVFDRQQLKTANLIQAGMDAKQYAARLSSPAMFGRGYQQNGLGKAEVLIEHIGDSLLQLQGITHSVQEVQYDVNVIEHCQLKFGKKELRPGADYLVNEMAPNAKFRSKKWHFLDAIHLSRDTVALFKAIQSVQKGAVVVWQNGTDELRKKMAYATLPLIAAKGANAVLLGVRKLTWSVGAVQLPIPVIELLDSVGKPKPGIGRISLEIKARLIPNFKSNNIMFTLPGKDSAILFSAHYDHLGMMGKTAIFPGANDNASGCSTVLALLELASKFHTPTSYTTHFVFFTGEECGLKGSAAFVEHPPINLKKLKFMVNLDLNGTGEEGIMVENADDVPETYVQLLFGNDHLTDPLPAIKKRANAPNSDHYYFSKAGVPSIFIYTLGGVRNYHDIHDRFQAPSFRKQADLIHLLFNLTGD